MAIRYSTPLRRTLTHQQHALLTRAALSRPPVRAAPKVRIVTFRGVRYYAQGNRLLRRVPNRRPPAFGGSGIGALARSPIGKVLGAIPGVGAVVNTIAQLAPVLDTSLQNVQCAPGNPNYPACLTPGGSAAALETSIGRETGLAPAVAAQIVAEAAQQGGLGGSGSVTGLERPTLREM